MTRLAFIDESHVPSTEHYLLAAVIVDRRKLDAVRDATLTVRRRRRAPFHWYTELDLSRTAMVDHIAAHTDLQLVVVSRPVARHRHERARARCLTSLLTQIQVLDPPVREVVLESRTDVLDKRDAARVDGLRASRRLGPDLRFSFGTKAEHARPEVSRPLLSCAATINSRSTARVTIILCR